MQERYLALSQEKRYKFILVGDSNVGKTALFWRFTQGQYLAEKETQVTTIDFKIKNVQIKQKSVKLYIWDTAGQQKFRSIVSTYFKGCQGVLLLFDVSRQSSFQNAVNQWYDLCKSKAQNAIIYMIGNKNDLEKKVSQAKINEFCNKHNIKYIATSVKTGMNVEEAFMSLAKAVNEKQQLPARGQSFSIGAAGKKKESSCC